MLNIDSSFVKYMLRTYASEDILSAAKAQVTRCIQGERMIEEKFERVLRAKVLRCGSLLEESQLKGYYIEGLRQNVRHWWSQNQ